MKMRKRWKISKKSGGFFSPKDQRRDKDHLSILYSYHRSHQNFFPFRKPKKKKPFVKKKIL